MSDPTPSAFPSAKLKLRRISPIWILPVVSAFIALFLGWHDYATHGPLITISFKTARGIVAGQTLVKYKDVTIGTVEGVEFSKDMSQIIVKSRMMGAAKPLFTDHARFWVVRLQFNTFNASDIESLVSGSYIQIEPGSEGGKQETHFVGLETPPTDRTDQPGTSFTLKAERIGAINTGAPVYYRDVVVGETLNTDLGNGFEPITLRVLIFSPYDKFVRKDSRFWNASGVSLSLGANGFHLETHSLRSVLLGGIAFDTPAIAANEEAEPEQSVYTLFDSEQEAVASRIARRLTYVAYFHSSAKTLVSGTPVLLYGLTVGQVTNVQLVFDRIKNESAVRVEFTVEPDRAFGKDANINQTPEETIQKLVDNGMRIKMETSSLLTAQKDLTFEFSPRSAPAERKKAGDIDVMPSVDDSGELMTTLNDVAAKLNQIPFDQIGANLSHLSESVDQLFASDEMKQAASHLSIALANAADISRKANTQLTPALQNLPTISAQLQLAVTHANQLFEGLQTTYGTESNVPQQLSRVLDQVNDAARSIRLLADFLERHPDAVLKGKDDGNK